jgi:hypothetical protein
MDVLPFLMDNICQPETIAKPPIESPLQFCSGFIGPVAAVRQYAADLSTGPSEIAQQIC